MSEESRIERLKRSLYSRDENIVPKEKRTPIQGQDINVQKNWGTKPSFNLSLENLSENNSFFNKFLLISMAFFVVALGIALFIFFGGANTISSSNVDIQVTSPSSISSGEELDMDLSIVNNNRADMQDVALFIDYPISSESIDGSKELSHERIGLDAIPKGQNKSYSVRALVFGEKDDVKDFNLRLEYKVQGSNAVFSKEKKYSVVISSSPLLLDVVSPKEIDSGGQLTFNVTVTSNSSVVMKNTLVKVMYPYGFTYKDSNIKPARDNSVWNLGDLKDSDKKTLTITGVLVGQNMEDRSFTFSAGTKNDQNSDFDTALATSQITIGIRKSFFDLSALSSSNNIGVIGQPMPVTIKWQNTLPDKIVNGHIEAVISSSILDRNSVKPTNGGFYRSIDNTVLWDKNTTPDLETLLPGNGGSMTFSVTSLPDSLQMKAIKNPHINVQVTMTGDRLGSEAGTVSSNANLIIKFQTTPTITVKSLKTTGPFSNSGPIPPRADQESTYTIQWTLTNTNNDLKDTTVTATLPQGVVWNGEISPQSEKVSYNSDSRSITWNVGNVTSGVGFTLSPREVYFKVGITPSVNQVGSSPSLLSNTSLDTTDTYVEKELQTSVGPITTICSDPGFRIENGNVLK